MSLQFPEHFNLADYYLFERLREGLGGKTAIRYGQRAYTYQEVADRTKALAAYLETIGVTREQRIYIVLPDTPPFAWAFFATLSHGAVVAMGNPYSPTEDLAYVIDYSRAAVLITVPRVAEALQSTLKDNKFLKAVLLVPENATGDDPEAPIHSGNKSSGSFATLALSEALQIGKKAPTVNRPPVKRDDVAVWLFTSGSTGRPKAAVHTHRDFAFNTEHYAKKTVGYRRDDVTLSVPRLFFGYSTGTNLMFPFSVGATTCLFSERPLPESLAQMIELYRPTIVTNVPTMMSKLLDYDDQLQREGKKRLDFSCIRFHLSAGEALPPPLLTRFIERFRNEVYDGIGSAEMFHIYVTNRPGDIKPGSLGRPVDGYTVRILPVDAEEPGAAEVPCNENGCMWVKGESVALEYFQDRDTSWRTFFGPWCRTGDLFRRDEQGYYWFSGRADSLFKVGGIFVAPLEIEECLMEHTAVSLAAVIPAKREDLDKPKAFVVLREESSAKCTNSTAKAALCKALQQHVQERLSKHKYPRWIVFVDDLPKNDRGKVDRKVLIDREKRGENPWE